MPYEYKSSKGLTQQKEVAFSYDLPELHLEELGESFGLFGASFGTLCCGLWCGSTSSSTGSLCSGTSTSAGSLSSGACSTSSNTFASTCTSTSTSTRTSLSGTTNSEINSVVKGGVLSDGSHARLMVGSRVDRRDLVNASREPTSHVSANNSVDSSAVNPLEELEHFRIVRCSLCERSQFLDNDVCVSDNDSSSIDVLRPGKVRGLRVGEGPGL